MTRFNHDEALRRFLNAAAKVGVPGFPMGTDHGGGEVHVHYIDGADLGREHAEGIKRAWEYASGGGISWWSENGRRGIAYPNGRGVMTPLLDGVTGDMVSFTKVEQHAAGYGQNNDAYRVMKAMERFDDLPLVS